MAVDWLIVQQNNASSEWNLHDADADITGAFKLGFNANTASFTMTTDSAPIQHVNNTGSVDVTVTLPAAANVSSQVYWIKNTNSASEITIAGTIDGDTDMTLHSIESVTLQSDGTEYWIL